MQKTKLSIAELARRTGHSSQAFNGKLEGRGSFTIEELEQVDEATETAFNCQFELQNGEKL